MNLKAFFVASLQSALDLGIATPDDLLKHITPDVLAATLPKPLWARLLTACLGAPRVDAQLVVETIGIPNFCEHVPSPLIWACVADIGARALGKDPLPAPRSISMSMSTSTSTPTEGDSIDEPLVLRPKSLTSPPPPPQPSSSRNKPLTAPPPDVITKPANPPLSPLPKVGPTIPTPSQTPAGTGSQSLADIVAELEADAVRESGSVESPFSTPSREAPTTPPPNRVRTPTQQRFRQSQTGSGIGRLAQNNARRPQAATSPSPVPAVPGGHKRRGETEVGGSSEELETETSVQKGDDWRNSLAVEEDQLVDWQSSEETLTVADDIDTRKR